MSARGCFAGKIKRGRVSPDAGQRLLEMLDRFERDHAHELGDNAAGRQAALDAAEEAIRAADRKADLARRSAIAQASVLRAAKVYDDVLQRLRAEGKAPVFLRGEQLTPFGAAARSLLARDPFEIATWNNVHYLARDIRGRAHSDFAGVIDDLRPKRLGFKAEAVKELDLLRAAHGEEANATAKLNLEAWWQVEGKLADQFIAAGGALVKRDRYFPNPDYDVTKVRAIGRERFVQYVGERVDRSQMLDFHSGRPLTDARFQELTGEAFDAITAEGRLDPPSAATPGRPMLANSRSASRFFVWKSAEAWQEVAEAIGMHSSPFQAMVSHIAGMAEDIAQLRILGPNPTATKRFILSVFDREAQRLSPSAADVQPERRLFGALPARGKAAEATRVGRKIEANVARQRRTFESLWDEVTGANRSPVDAELARHSGNVRSILMAGQLGSAIVSSITDPALALMAARFNGVPAARVLTRAVRDLFRKGSEVEAAQLGVTADSLAHTLGEADRVMGETIRTGTAAKLGPAVIRVQGLRRWTAVWRGAYFQETTAFAAREASKRFGELEPEFRQGLQRYGIAADDWDAIRKTAPYEPRPNAPFIRPVDVDDGSAAGRAASEKWAQYINTELDHAVIDQDPVTRALLLGQSRPGTAGGETRRSVTMYRAWPATLMMTLFMRTFARGFGDGRRLTHGALTFIAMTMMGALAMQAKELLQGRDPMPMTGDRAAHAWARAILQGGGLGIFGDILFLDQTRFGNSWAATGAGAVFGAVESIVGDFLFANIQAALRGEETDFLGDALYIAGRYLPGSSLWFARLPFQRAVIDQLAGVIDPDAQQRFAGMEGRAMRDWGQRYWWAPGRPAPQRAPDLGAVVRND